VVCGSITVSKRNPHSRKVYYEDGHLAVWKQGRILDLGRLADTDVCIAPAINSHFEIVGSMSQKGLGHGDGPPNSSHIFLWSRGYLRDFGVEGSATAINDSGQFVGQKEWAQGKYGYQHGLLYTNGRMQEIWKSSTIDWINNKGQMVGHALTPLLWDKGTAQEIRLPPQCAFDAQHAPKINDAGQIIINAYTAGAADADGHQYLHDQCYLYQNGKVVRLKVLPGFTDMVGTAINNHGEGVGNAVVTGVHYKSCPFLWKNGIIYDLNKLVLHSGWMLTDANGINNRGQIIGSGIHNGKPQSFLLTPYG
jgi:probable HAF family extracellular repeat protein